MDLKDKNTEFVKLRNNRMKNSIRTALSGLVLVVISTVFPFIIRTIFVYTLGDNYLGLNSLYMSIMQLLNMSELGIGSVMVFFLYKPIAQNDIEKINAFLNELKGLYHIIGFIILTVGLMITPFLHVFISGDIPPGCNIYFLFCIYLIASVLQFFLYPEEVILLNAFQRGDLANKITIFSNMLGYILQLISLLVFRSYFLYLEALIIQTIYVGVLREKYSNKYFVDIQPHGKITNDERLDIRKRVLSMVGHQMDEKLLNSIDNIFISSVLGLSAVAIYGNYFYVITAITMLFEAIYGSALSSIGNAIATEDIEDNYYRFRCLFWLNACFAGIATNCLFCLYQSFMKLWMGNRILNENMVFLFCIYLYISQLRKSVIVFKNAAGMWWNDRYKPYVSMIVDLILDAVLINIIGIEGAIISSIVCIAVIELPWETKVLFDDYFKRSPCSYVKSIAGYSLVNFFALLVSVCVKKLVINRSDIISVGLQFVFCCVISILVDVLVYYKTDIYKTWKTALKKIK